MKVDLVANEPHFLDHLGPVALELRSRGMLGRTWVGDLVADHDMERWATLKPRRMTARDKRTNTPTLVASITDVNQALQRGRLPILMEHGAGQHYSTRHKSYIGGLGRENCLLVLVPNEASVERHRGQYPHGPKAVAVGSPRVDMLVEEHAGKEWSDPPTVAVSFHWDCQISPEAGSAWNHLGVPILRELVAMREAGFINLYAHAHPRIADTVRRTADHLDVAFLEHFTDVCNLADLYMVDNSSTLFEFAALDRPVVVVNSPTYRRRAQHGLRFWDYADIGPQVGSAKVAARAVTSALADPPGMAEQRHRYIETIYGPQDGKSAVRAVDAIVERLS